MKCYYGCDYTKFEYIGVTKVNKAEIILKSCHIHVPSWKLKVHLYAVYDLYINGFLSFRSIISITYILYIKHKKNIFAGQK